MALYRAELPHYVCGFEVENEIIVRCAPIMAWAMGKPLDTYAQWARQKGGSVIMISANPLHMEGCLDS